MEEARKHLMDRFQERLFDSYEAYCTTHQLDQGISGFITYLIDQELIQIPTLKRYTIKKEYEELQLNGKYKKTQAVQQLADRFNISTRSVWTIIRSDSHRAALRD